MELTAAVASFALVVALVTITPGLDTALVLRTAALLGRRHAVATSLGISTGLLVWAVAAAVGISALLTASDVAYAMLRTVGAFYMVALGVRLIVAAVRGTAAHGAGGVGEPSDAGEPADAGAPAAASPAGVAACFRQGFLTNLLNPKIGAFYVALLPQFLPAGYPPAVSGVLLAGVHVVETMVWFALIIVGVERLGAWLRRPRVQRGVDAVVGVAITGFGVRLGLSQA